MARRQCLGGSNGGSLCNENADCPGSTCRDRNIFNLSVAVHYDAPAADLTAIENMLTATSAVLLDVTDGQAEIGSATIHNDAAGTAEADLRVYPATCTTGPNTGAVCATNANCGVDEECGVWWQANTGDFRVGGSMHVSINNIMAAASPGNVLAHEFVHLIFDARDEYESRPACGANTGNASCPDPGAGAAECLMDSNGTELCWGQGNAANLTDLSAGNHDATNVTEQSQCRSNRSCWAQVVWSWPNTFVMPAGAPNPGTGGAVPGPVQFIRTNDTVRVVLVLDESGSMALESPSRVARLKVAAGDFLTLADADAEVGLVSFASDAATSSGRKVEAIGPLSTRRPALTTATNNLAPSTRTNIGAGLAAAKGLIDAAGGVTGSTYVVLMTDGLNNEPQPQSVADSELQSQLDVLSNAGIPVYVTCTGSDLGLQSQCSEIATATNGFYVDSSDASQLPLSFVDMVERISGHEAIHFAEGKLSKPDALTVHEVYVDPGSRSLTFTLQWQDPQASAQMRIQDPDGNAIDTLSMPQGRFARVRSPKAGMWRVTQVSEKQPGSAFRLRAWSRHPTNNLGAAFRKPTTTPGGDLVVYAYPRGPGGALTHLDGKVVARVRRPNGSIDTLDLFDRGHTPGGPGSTDLGDDVARDGVFTGVYRNTSLLGAYSFTLGIGIDGWVLGDDAHERNPTKRDARFVRGVTLSAAVHDPNRDEPTPEDDRPPVPPQKAPCERFACALLVGIAVLLLLLLLLVWRCCRRLAVRSAD